MDVVVKQVTDKTMLKQFVKVPFKIFKDDPYWVPPLISERMDFLNREKNPFFKHSEAEYFIAYRDGEAVGTIAAIINNNHNKVHNENIGFFGFFDTFNDKEVATALFTRAEDYLRDKGFEAVRGPACFSSNDEWGMLIEGFDSSPVVMMLYNPDYYNNLVSDVGYEKAKDLYAWMLYSKTYDYDHNNLPEQMKRIRNIVGKRYGVEIKTVELKHLDKAINTIIDIYTEAWELNWGFIPMEREEMEHMGQGLKNIADPNMVLVAEVKGKPVGFALNLPDVHWVLKKVNGSLLPFGWLKWLYYKKKTPLMRTLTLGVIPEYRGRGIEAALIYETIKYGVTRFEGSEASWVLEDNIAMNRILENMGADLYKKYRIYEKKL